jgi:hypothetical protein
MLLQHTGIADATLVLRVMDDAPAPSVDPIVAFDELGEGSPARDVEGSDCEGHARHLNRPVSNNRSPSVSLPSQPFTGISRSYQD